MIEVAAAEAVAMMRAAVDALFDADLSTLSPAGVTGLLRELETQKRRLAAVDHRLVAEVGERRLAGDFGRTSVADLLVDLLRVTPGEAKARVGQADELGPRRTITGEALPPLLPATAAAVRDGQIATGHVAVIATTLDRLPAGLAVEACGVAEAMLVEAALHEHPKALERTAAVLSARLDPDGQAPREAELERRREFTLISRADGSARVRGEFTPEGTAMWQAVLDSLAAPRRATAGQDADALPDQRTPGQRRHDAMVEAAARLLRSGSLPAAGGTPVTVVLHTTQAELRDPNGLAHTATGDVWPMTRVRPLLGDTAIMPIVFDHHGAVLACGRTRRLATKAQRLALAARDGGCSFPGCSRPAAWTEAHHVIEWDAGGPTDLENLCLLCRWHHRNFAAHGWQVEMWRGLPRWIPPPWIDPDRRPLRNTAHRCSSGEGSIGSQRLTFRSDTQSRTRC